VAKRFKNSRGESFTSKAAGAKLISGKSGAWRVKGSDQTFATFHRAKHVANRLASRGRSGSSAKRNTFVPTTPGAGYTWLQDDWDEVYESVLQENGVFAYKVIGRVDENANLPAGFHPEDTLIAVAFDNRDYRVYLLSEADHMGRAWDESFSNAHEAEKFALNKLRKYAGKGQVFPSDGYNWPPM